MPNPMRIGLGTEKSDVNPWESYDQEMDPTRMWSAEMKKRVEEYSQRRHDKAHSAGLEEVMHQNELSTMKVKEYRFDHLDSLHAAGDMNGYY